MSLNFSYNKKDVTHHLVCYSPHTCGDFYTGVLCNADNSSINGVGFRLYNEGLVKYAEYNKYEPQKPTTTLVRSLGDQGLAISKEMLSIAYKTGAVNYIEQCLDYFTTMLTIKNACEHGKLNDVDMPEVIPLLEEQIQNQNQIYHCSMNTGLLKNPDVNNYLLAGLCPYRIKLYTIDIDNPVDMRYTLLDMYYKNSDDRWYTLVENFFTHMNNVASMRNKVYQVIQNPWTTVIEDDLSQFPDSDPEIVKHNYHIYRLWRIQELDELWDKAVSDGKKREIENIIAQWMEKNA